MMIRLTLWFYLFSSNLFLMNNLWLKKDESGEFIYITMHFQNRYLSNSFFNYLLPLNWFLGSARLDVAFTAVPSSTNTYSSGSAIQFKTIKTNIGNAFNRSNYRFTAPSSGLYIFSWRLSIHSSYVGNNNLVINGSTFHSLYCQKTYQQCGSTVTVWLNRNDQVWILSAYSNIYVYAQYSSFSGWKVH